MSIQLAAKQQADPAVTRWAGELTDGCATSRQVDGLKLTIHENDHASLLDVRLSGAARLEAGHFEKRVAEIYALIRGELAGLRHPYPVRFWNYLPAIHEPMDKCRDRYMVFNAGRFAALDAWFDGLANLPRRLPAASGVGHAGEDLVIHCLALARPGTPIDNPRQITTFRYSSRYGALPPCFARGTLIEHPIDGRRVLIAAGTASIRGEESVHIGDLHEQMSETLENLGSLLAAARPGATVGLSAFTDLRIYHPRPRDAATIESKAREAFGDGARIELLRADLCRADLLVEIEGIAQVDGRETDR